MKKRQLLGPYEQLVRVARSTRLNHLEVEATGQQQTWPPGSESLWVAGNRPASRAHTAFLTGSRARARSSYDPEGYIYKYMYMY